jgi:ankyrin repeat domain-containing protein 50
MLRLSYGTAKCVFPRFATVVILREGHNELRFSHFSIKEYLISERILTSVSANFRIVDPFAHELVTRISIIYLLSVHDATSTQTESCNDFPFSNYSAKFWFSHFDAVEPEKHRILETTLARRLFEVTSNATWLCLYDPDRPYFNRLPVTDEPQGDRHPTSPPPLYYSCRLGFVNITKWLLDSRGADSNAQGGSYGNALNVASYYGHQGIVELLLERGVDVNAQHESHGTALRLASYFGHRGIVELLLERGADVNQVGSYDSPLRLASYFGHRGIVELLLERGANINAQCGSYGNALNAASYYGHRGIVELLLERGADVNAQGGFQGNALNAASFSGHRGIVELLMERGANFNDHEAWGYE